MWPASLRADSTTGLAVGHFSSTRVWTATPYREILSTGRYFFYRRRFIERFGRPHSRTGLTRPCYNPAVGSQIESCTRPTKFELDSQFSLALRFGALVVVPASSGSCSVCLNCYLP